CRNYPDSYWDKKTMAPSCLIYFIGLNRKTDLHHHTLFFEEDLWQHSLDIYKNPRWPSRPLFYCCCPSRTDLSVAPEGHENLFLLMPIAPGLNDDEQTREKYFEIMMSRLQDYTGIDLREHIDYKRSYCIQDFIEDYNAFKGNAYGL
ncbi:MAG TPA: phytoene desaturase, partial [Chitinophagaceae bacterium]|nr:phytoene desaturase [Chitinophagaceae bacterium]